jgi:hypothetical protein
MGSILPGPTFLGGIPATLQSELLDAYTEIVRNYRERRWEPSELNAGKFCEVVYTILRGHVDGSYPKKAAKPRNMVDACKALENADQAVYSRSVRIQIPRMLVAVYEVRNNRGVGHVGGDVNANNMDATCVLHICQWMLAELVRIFHATTVDAAAQLVDTLVQRIVPVIWAVDGKYRVLDTSLSMKEKTLLLLYHHPSAALRESDLCAWAEHSNSSVYRRDVLRPMHTMKLIEYDAGSRSVTLSPKGIALVETTLLS